MTLDITRVQFASTIDTFKNEPTATGSITTTAQSVPSGEFRTFSTTIALGRTDATTLIYQNYSFDSSKYYIGSFVVVDADANFEAQTRMFINSSTLTVELYVINQTGSTQTSPVFTLALQVRRFVAPFTS